MILWLSPNPKQIQQKYQKILQAKILKTYE